MSRFDRWMLRLGGTVAGACGILAMYWPRRLSNDLPEVNLFVGCMVFIGAWMISFRPVLKKLVEYVPPPRVVDIVILFCRHCDVRVGAVSHQDFYKIQEAKITLYCESCCRRVEAEEYREAARPDHKPTKR